MIANCVQIPLHEVAAAISNMGLTMSIVLVGDREQLAPTFVDPVIHKPRKLIEVHGKRGFEWYRLHLRSALAAVMDTHAGAYEHLTVCFRVSLLSLPTTMNL